MSTTQTFQTSSGDVLTFSSTSQNVYLNTNIDVQYIKSIIKGNLIQPRFRFFLLNPDETVKYQINSEDIIKAGSYSENYQDGQRRSTSFTLFNSNGKYLPNINNIWVDNKISLELGLELVTGQTVWVKKGTYMIESITPTESHDSQNVELKLNDKWGNLSGKLGTLETTYEIEIGANIEQVIQGILNIDKGNGYILDPLPFVYHSSFKGKTVQAKISKQSGSTYADILLELATQLSAEIFYNANGNLTLIPTQESTLDIDKPVLFDFEDVNGDMSQISWTFDMKEIINRVIVIGATVNGAVYDATAVNEDTSSPLCYQRIGYRTGSPINDSNIFSDLLAQERAKYELRKILILKSVTSLPVFFNPLLTVNNLVTLTDEYFGLEQQKFLIKEISCSLDFSGQMSMSISNLKNLPFISS